MLIIEAELSPVQTVGAGSGVCDRDICNSFAVKNMGVEREKRKERKKRDEAQD